MIKIILFVLNKYIYQWNMKPYGFHYLKKKLYNLCWIYLFLSKYGMWHVICPWSKYELYFFVRTTNDPWLCYLWYILEKIKAQYDLLLGENNILGTCRSIYHRLLGYCILHQTLCCWLHLLLVPICLYEVWINFLWKIILCSSTPQGTSSV